MNSDADSDVLGTSEAWALLRAAEVGRLAVVVHGRPDIFPVNYIVDHGTLVFRTASGTKLDGAVMDALVAFEVDGVDGVDGTAWSVVVKGTAREIVGVHSLLETMELPLFPWHSSPKHRFVRITADDVSGRRFSVVDRTGN